MKLSVFFLIAAFIGFLVLFFQKQNLSVQSKNESSNQLPIKPKNDVEAEKPLISQEPLSKILPSAHIPNLEVKKKLNLHENNLNLVNPRYRLKPKDMNVEFEVINGMAVAFGDSILGKPSSDFNERSGITEMQHPRFWEQGMVPYVIKDDVTNSEQIKKAIEIFHSQTTVRFVPYEGQGDAVVFLKGEENCYSYLGRTGGLQPIFLSEKCSAREIAHEMMHVLGFIHEQSRTDRDQAVEIIWENIEEKYQAQFAMVPEVFMDAYFNSPFDTSSIMMYDSHAFAKSKELETIKLKSGEYFKINKGILSASDVERVNRLYHGVEK